MEAPVRRYQTTQTQQCRRSKVELNDIRSPFIPTSDTLKNCYRKLRFENKVVGSGTMPAPHVALPLLFG